MNADREQLAEYINRSDVQDDILGAYEGGYSLGLALDPNNPAGVAVRVRIEGEDANNIADHIVWEGQRIPVVVSTNFRVPIPQHASNTPVTPVTW